MRGTSTISLFTKRVRDGGSLIKKEIGKSPSSSPLNGKTQVGGGVHFTLRNQSGHFMSIWVVPREPSRPKQGEKVFLFAPPDRGFRPGWQKASLPADRRRPAKPDSARVAEAAVPKFNRSFRMERWKKRLLERRVRVGL
jgi:hypothetical protein